VFSFRSSTTPLSPLFPYTTLFRSADRAARPLAERRLGLAGQPTAFGVEEDARGLAAGFENCDRREAIDREGFAVAVAQIDRDGRSEEHTSELQSRRDLVCRLLLEK